VIAVPTRRGVIATTATINPGISQRIGGDQIDYADESPVVRETFAKALAENGLVPKMDEAYAAEMADLPPKPGQPVPVA